MGMWKKDQLYGGERLTEHVHIGQNAVDAEQVVLFDIGIISDEVPTDLGNATKTALVIGKITDKGKIADVLTVNTLAQAVAQKAREKADGDLPAVVCFFTTPASKAEYSDATVMQFVSRWSGDVPDYQPVTETIPY